MLHSLNIISYDCKYTVVHTAIYIDYSLRRVDSYLGENDKQMAARKDHLLQDKNIARHHIIYPKMADICIYITRKKGL